MGNEFKGIASHSAEYFGDARDHWWNEDFLGLVAGSWRPREIRSVLDVGCGVGHWGRLLLRVLPDQPGQPKLRGVDREPLWVAKAGERAAAAGLASRARYEVATAEALPFEDGAFDLVTCQTLLMHLRDPAAALAEMVRVTRPGGLVVAAEPTNVFGPVLEHALILGDPPDLIASLVRFQLVCLRGKAALGEGNDLIGESLPALFAAAGLSGVSARQNDRPSPMLPPYASPYERALVEEITDYAARGIWIWDRAQTRRYFLAGGGAEGELDPLWASAMSLMSRTAEAMAAGRYASAGGGLFYLVWGRRP